jgi:hypothetical protein
MTLIVSLRIPDGIVIAGDSLATMMGNLEVKADVNIACPSCGHQHITNVALPGISMPSTTLSFAQKVFPFLDIFGVGTFGAGQLVGKTIYFAVRELEKELLRKSLNQRPSNVTEAASSIGERALRMLREHIKAEGVDIDSMPDEWRPLGFQVVGYDGDKATTVELNIGKDVRATPHVGGGFTVTGQINVVQAFDNLYTADPNQNPMIDVFSLQDATTYAEFLINTTATHQRFARTIAGVGGEVDIALVTPFDHFKWIQQKSLQSIISAKSQEAKDGKKKQN